MKTIIFDRIFIWLTIFSISMGFLEGAVVVYIRELYYPGGFEFPLVPMEEHLAVTELFRELATMFMLLGIAVVAGKNAIERFAWFIYCFAVWDIFYYVFLKAILNWPESLLTDDVLFLIPAMWVGPVIAPVILSCTMIIFAILIVKFMKQHNKVITTKIHWTLLIFGSLVVITGFIWDFSKFVIQEFNFNDIWYLPFEEATMMIMSRYYPETFNWAIFIAGEAIIVTAIFLIYFRNSKMEKSM